VKKVLIIEDDKDTLDAFHYIAEDLKLNVVISPSILQVDDIQAISPDLILLDHWVGNKLGGDFCLEIKANPAIKHIPVILISAHSSVEQIAVKSCADSYLAKPFDLDELMNIINHFAD
jgi:two-component system cell cycle response regulator DivK